MDEAKKKRLEDAGWAVGSAEDFLSSEPVTVPDIYVRWETIGGDKFHGKLVEVDSNVLIVDCSDGVRRGVEEDGAVQCASDGSDL